MSRVLVFFFLFLAGFALGWGASNVLRARRRRREGTP
jgi:hypothetical protein